MSFSHDIAEYPEGIVLPVDKPWRWTSADVIRKLKWAAIKHFRKRNLKVGHAGTLDPLATGVLLVCIGPACKRAQALQDHDKEYVAGIRLGATTPSYDREKDVDRFFPYQHITADAVRAALAAMEGEQEQVAPLFSAKSVDGVRAYEMARKLLKNAQRGLQDADFDAAALDVLQRSRIIIHRAELLDFQPGTSGSGVGQNFLSHFPGEKVLVPGGQPEVPAASAVPGAEKGASSRIHVIDPLEQLPLARVRIVCSKGTYIRAFARDLGEALGSGAHLDSLARTRTGDYTLENALSLEQALALLAEESPECPE